MRQAGCRAGPGSCRSCPLPVRGEETKVKVMGEGPAYDQVGKLAVMHAGRVKPLDTVAREEVKHVFGRETIKLHDAANKVVETWGPVGAFLDWMVRPEFWDDQPFILVDYLPLRQVDPGRLGPVAAEGRSPPSRPRPPKIAPRSAKLAEAHRAHRPGPHGLLNGSKLARRTIADRSPSSRPSWAKSTSGSPPASWRTPRSPTKGSPLPSWTGWPSSTTRSRSSTPIPSRPSG